MVSIDKIATMQDEEIFEKMTGIENSIQKARRKGLDSKKLEVELSYYQRENQIRNARAAAHQAWLEKQNIYA